MLASYALYLIGCHQGVETEMAKSEDATMTQWFRNHAQRTSIQMAIGDHDRLMYTAFESPRGSRLYVRIVLASREYTLETACENDFHY